MAMLLNYVQNVKQIFEKLGKREGEKNLWPCLLTPQFAGFLKSFPQEIPQVTAVLVKRE